jgi:hypothetical protein
MMMVMKDGKKRIKSPPFDAIKKRRIEPLSASSDSTYGSTANSEHVIITVSPSSSTSSSTSASAAPNVTNFENTKVESDTQKREFDAQKEKRRKQQEEIAFMLQHQMDPELRRLYVIAYTNFDYLMHDPWVAQDSILQCYLSIIVEAWLVADRIKPKTRQRETRQKIKVLSKEEEREEGELIEDSSSDHRPNICLCNGQSLKSCKFTKCVQGFWINNDTERRFVIDRIYHLCASVHPYATMKNLLYSFYLMLTLSLVKTFTHNISNFYLFFLMALHSSIKYNSDTPIFMYEWLVFVPRNYSQDQEISEHDYDYFDECLQSFKNLELKFQKLTQFNIADLDLVNSTTPYPGFSSFYFHLFQCIYYRYKFLIVPPLFHRPTKTLIRS